MSMAGAPIFLLFFFSGAVQPKSQHWGGGYDSGEKKGERGTEEGRREGATNGGFEAFREYCAEASFRVWILLQQANIWLPFPFFKKSKIHFRALLANTNNRRRGDKGVDLLLNFLSFSPSPSSLFVEFLSL